MIEDWKRILSTRAAEWGLPAGGEWNVLFHNSYQPTGSTINLLWFHGNESFPRTVTKMGRDQAILTREYDNLQAVYRVAPRYVPRPMHLGCADGFWMLWMEGVPGRRIPPGRRHPASVLTQSVDMLVSIHSAVAKGIEQSAMDRHARMVTAPIDALLQYGGPAVRERCHGLLETATAGWLQSIPVIPQHGDLFLDNVLRYREECHIVDWEVFGVVDLPFHDLLTLLLSFLSASASAPERWDADLRRRIPSLIERYACGMKLPASAVSVLLPLTLANRFYLHWIEGRAAAVVMYAAIKHYFEHTAYWQEVFLGREHPI